MIGNKIQSLYLVEQDYPEAAALSFMMMAAILIAVLVYIRLAGTEAFMGEETTRKSSMSRSRGRGDGLRATRDRDVRRPRGRLHADPDRGDRRLLVRRHAAGKLTFGLRRLHPRVLASTRSPIAALNDALLTSIKLAALATLVSTAIGTAMALALVRYQFFGRKAANLLIILPMASPEIVIGAALLSMFIVYSLPLGFTTLLIAHIMFSISFVVVVVRSRLIGFDRSPRGGGRRPRAQARGDVPARSRCR